MGFFSHLFRSPVFKVAAPLLLSATGIGAPLGAALSGGLGLGLGAAGSTALGSGLLGAGLGAIEGGGLKGAALGGLSGGIGGYVQGSGGIGNAISNAGFPTIGSAITNVGNKVSNGLGSIFSGLNSQPTINGYNISSGAFGSSGSPFSSYPGSLTGFGVTAGSPIVSSAYSSGGGLGSLFSSPNTIANIYSGIQGTQAAKEMANAQLASTNAALAQQAKIYGQTQNNLNPFITSGQSANKSLSGLLGLNGGDQASQLAALEATPGYQFRLQQGTKSLNQSLAAQGGLYSGQALKAADQFGQGLAAQTYNDAINQYQNASNQGQNAALQLGGFGQNFANTSSGLLTDQGNIAANRINNQNNTQNQSIANILGLNVGGFYGGQSSPYDALLKSLQRPSQYGVF